MGRDGARRPDPMIPKNARPSGIPRPPPHPATVAQPKRPVPGIAPRPPHAAMVALRRAAPAGAAALPPHPAKRAATRPGPAGGRSLQRMEQPSRPLHELLWEVLANDELSSDEKPRLVSAYKEGGESAFWSEYSSILSGRTYHYEKKVVNEGRKEPIINHSSSDAVKLSNDVLKLAKVETQGGNPKWVVGWLSDTIGERGIKVGENKEFSSKFSLIGDDAEIVVSQEDGEVGVLSSALAILRQKPPPVVQLIILGPYGPCDGCKRRILRFVQLVLEIGEVQHVIVHYLYGQVLEKYRGDEKIKSQTTYGSETDVVIEYKGARFRIHTWVGKK